VMSRLVMGGVNAHIKGARLSVSTLPPEG
jgi:hypothetical protein